MHTLHSNGTLYSHGAATLLEQALSINTIIMPGDFRSSHSWLFCTAERCSHHCIGTYFLHMVQQVDQIVAGTPRS